ncbi:MAG: thioredoxin [Chloroflexaceae bacterium]|nr:thioredoxin [Chloroflexaceae bacterium]
MGKPVVITDNDFESQVLKSNTPVVVDFWAPWCGPCRQIAPTLEELATEYDGRLVIAKLNVDENNDWPSRLGIQGIPTLIVFKNGEPVQRIVGARPKNDYKKVFDGLA